jgi:ribosome recycling factor
MTEDLIALLRQKFGKVIENTDEDFATVRVGRAKPDMIENLIINAYGGKMRLMEVASINAPDPNMLVVSPYDKGLMGASEKGIGDNEMKLSPVVNGDVIRIVIPALTQERRMDFVKLLKQKVESAKIMLRQARQDVKEKIDALKESKTVSEDEIHRLLEELDKVTAEFTTKIEEMAKKKEDEIMAV